MHLAINRNGHSSNVGQRELAVLDEASRVMAVATTLEEVTTVRNQAEAARVLAKAAQLGLEVQNRAAELRLRAERKAGTFLAGLKLRGGDRKSKGQRASLKLEDLGVTRDQSKRWQRLASVPDGEFSSYLDVSRSQGQEVTAAGLLRTWNKCRTRRSSRAQQATTSRPVVLEAVLPIAAQETISELRNHHELLARILKPVLENENCPLKCAERRMAERLLREIGELLESFGIE